MRHNFALTFLLSLTVTFCATAQETFTHETLPPNAAVRKGEVTPSTTDFIRKSSAVMFNGRSDEWEIVRVPWDVFGIDDKTVLSRLNLTSDEWRETENCYRSCGLTIISDQSLRSDCQKAAQNNLSKGAACMCRHDGFIANVRGCHDQCFPKNHTLPLEDAPSTRCTDILAAEKNGAPLISVSFLTLTATAIFAVIA